MRTIRWSQGREFGIFWAVAVILLLATNHRAQPPPPPPIQPGKAGEPATGPEGRVTLVQTWRGGQPPSPPGTWFGGHWRQWPSWQIEPAGQHVPLQSTWPGGQAQRWTTWPEGSVTRVQTWPGGQQTSPHGDRFGGHWRPGACGGRARGEGH